MIPDRTDIHAMCALCDVCVFNNGEIGHDCKEPTDTGCLLVSDTNLERGRVWAFRISDGTVVVIDLEDKSKALGYSWRRHDRTCHINAVIEGRTVQLHRLVMGAKDASVLVDHRRHDVNDNRKSQLRKATKSENRQNTRKRAGASSRYLGVYFDERRGWAASIQTQVDGKRKNRHLGYYDDEWEAAEAFNRAASAAYGEYAVLNKRAADGGGQGEAGHHARQDRPSTD
jgi:hypothetical protein